MKIDCDTCTVRGDACADCVVSFLTIPVRTGAPAPVPGSAGLERAADMDADQVRAVRNLAAAGLVPPLRHQRAG